MNNKFITIADPQVYARLTTGQAFKNIAKYLSYDYIEIPLQDVCCIFDYKDSARGIFVFEAAMAKIGHITVKQLRSYFPNMKFVCLGGDSIWYLKGGQHEWRDNLLYDKDNGYEIIRPQDVDLWLDLLNEVVDEYNKRGIVADSWMWTTSETLVEYFSQKIPLPKSKDFICLINLKTDYRVQLFEYLKQNKYTVTNNIGWDLDELHKAYSTSRFAIGTTSPSWLGATRTMKGFRDWIAPLCGTVLIYDDHIDVIEKYHSCPLYTYDDYSSIIDTANNIDTVEYNDILEEQQNWVRANTIEKQLLRKFKEYKICEF